MILAVLTPIGLIFGFVYDGLQAAKLDEQEKRDFVKVDGYIGPIELISAIMLSFTIIFLII